MLANIRGGGEFGPAWHKAGLKTNRQRVYDDFAAVAQDLIARKITAPRRLGIKGGSNGGLLMGVEFTQHPGAVERGRHPGAAARHAALRADRRRRVLGRRVRQPSVPDGARLPRVDLAATTTSSRACSIREPLIWTTTKDDRVGPQHARKFAARLARCGYPTSFTR